MRQASGARKWLWAPVLAAVVTGCDVDVFGFAARPLVGPYALVQIETGGPYVLEGPGRSLDRRADPDRRDKLLDGYVRRIGWDEERILVERVPASGAADSTDFVIVGLDDHQVRGPVSAAVVAAAPELRALRLISAGAAYRGERAGGHLSQ